ncbi:apolipoprotein B-100 [Solea senegalensis]|nr:apolipoprotein B-100 [Solea senegalensis]KAG7510147.1 apolipoprotein B-100 [Solea senegalensis]
MMGYGKLCLLLLLSSYTLGQEGSSIHGEACSLASRFKVYKKYVYQYTTESRNGVAGTANLRNGPKVSCQVEIEVPEACRFIMHTSDCALSEIFDMDARGQPVYRPARSFEAFKTAMEKNTLKFTVDDAAHVQLYPETDEPVNILNIKRGIVSALVVPVIGEGQSSIMSTVHGLCLTDNLVNARGDIPTDVTLYRDLSQCDQFHSRELANSPLALLQKLHHPISKLITSSQDCDYQFDNKGRHITTAKCTEKHIYLPLSHEEHGISSVVTQDLSFQGSKRINNRLFDVNLSQSKPLHFEDPDDKTPLQTKDTAVSILRELAALSDTDQGQKRPSLFHKLVSSLRVLRNETLSQTVTEMLDVSPWLTWQALFQCGTSECTSAILQAIRTVDGLSLEMDALVYGLSLQADPDAARVTDMLSMAQYRQSRAIMYALANTVKKFYEGEVTPQVTDVSKFMEMLLNDCSGERTNSDSDSPTDPHEMSFLVLRVVGVMGQAMQAASPNLISSILRCARKTDIPLSNQKAAIQAFRLMDINDKVRNVLLEVFQDARSAVEKRIASYLILMKNPHRALVKDIVQKLENERDEQVNNFVVSHLKNILVSNEPQLHQLKEYIDLALKDHPPSTNEAYDGMSRNYKTDSPLGSARANIIFDGRDTLPKEVMLETTLRAFDYNYDLFEVGIEGTGFEPTIEALFGHKGFFPDSISRITYWAGDKAQMLRDVLDRISPDRVKRQVPQDLLKDLTNNIQKLVDDVRLSQAPEAIAYLRLLGNEIGYMKTSEMRKMVEQYYSVFMKYLPYKFLMSLVYSTNNRVFAHYIFMENAFSLPTASGFPLKFSLAGVFAPGAKGGLAHAVRSGTTELSFMPSVGIEFITQMGVHIPEFVEAGLEMHTNMYHENSINAKVTINRHQMRLLIPAPKSNIQLFSVSNQLLSVSSRETVPVPSLIKDRTESTDCQPLFSGVKLCTRLHYSNATSGDGTPHYHPLAGESRFAVEIQPTGEISEYTATIEMLKEGKRGRHTVDGLKLTLKAEGDDSTEATVTLKYNRNKNILTTDVVIPDYDVEAGIKVAVTDNDPRGKKMRGITIDVTNKNIPQLTLVGRIRLDRMKDAMIQLQMAIPSLKTNASVTATLKKNEDVLMGVETVITLPEMSYQQKASLKYGDDKFQMELKSNLNSEIHKLIPDLEVHHEQLQQLIDNILDQKVAKTDMKLRHIVTKAIEAGNIWLDKFAAHIPYLANLRSKRSLSDLTLPPLPEKLFLQLDSLFRYQFNKEKMAVSLPLPLGGKKSKELNIPTSLSTPYINLGLILFPPRTYELPSFTIPPTLDFSIPLLGLAEASTKINSNVYLWEGSISGGNNTVDIPSYIVQYKAMAQSPLNLLSYKFEGAGLMSGRADDHLKYLLNTSFSHCLIDTSFSVMDTLRVTNKLNAKANYRVEASSPMGLQASIYYSAQSTSTLNSDEVSGDGTVDGLLKIGPFYTNTSYTNSYYLRPLDRKGRGESTLEFDSPFVHLHNRIHGVYANSELNLVSKTNVQRDTIKHVAEVKYKDAKLTLKCNALAAVMGKSLSKKIEFGVSNDMGIIRIESHADDVTNRAYSLITGLLDVNGLKLNSEGSLTSVAGRGLHKASVMVGRKGLSTSGTNSIQFSSVTVENIYNGVIDSNGATLSSMTKAMAEESRGELNIEGKVTGVEASLDGVFKGHAYDATTRNNMNVLLNRRALTFTGNSIGMLNRMKTENSHSLTLTLWTLALRSKSNNIICTDIYYKQDTKLDMKPFVMSFDMTNDLKYNDVDLKNEGHLKLEPKKVDLSGSMKGAYGEEYNMKHIYELTYDDMAGAIKYSTSGDVLDAQISHNCELEFAGLSSKSKCEARINSEPLRFDSTVRTMALPFSVSVDALVNSDGEIKLYGKHSGQLYSKLLVKAEPLALAYSHDSRVSTTHFLSGEEASTNLDNKWDGLLTPSDQYLEWKVKSKLNNHTYNQDISTYNNPQQTGLEFSGALLTDIFSPLFKDKSSPPEIQEFSMTGFLKYDKNTNCHIIHIPFIESLPVAFEKFKTTFVQALESLLWFINSLDISQLITDTSAKLDGLPKQVRDFMQKMDLENKMNQAKAKLDYLIDEFAVTTDDLELALSDLSKNLENTVVDIGTKIRDLISTVKDYFKEGHLDTKITNILSKIGYQLQAFDEKYKIRQSLVKVLHALEDVIRQIDLQKLSETSTAWLRELDSEYRIIEKIKDTLSAIKQEIENFDVRMFFKDLNDYFRSIDLVKYVEQLSYKIPHSDIAKVIESMNEVIVNWIDEYEISNKLNAVYFYIRDLFLKYNLDDKLKQLMDQIVVLVEEFKIDSTVQSVVDALKSINFEFVYDEIIQILHIATQRLRAIDFKDSINDLNEHISSLLKSMKNFDYNAFVDAANRKIAELTHYINEQFKIYEIVQKIEAVRDFFIKIQNSLTTYLDKLKNTKVADALKKLANVINATFYNDVKLKVQDMLEDMKQRILDMDIRDEMYIHLQRASESYSNVVAFITMQFQQLTEKMGQVVKDNNVINQIVEAVYTLLGALKRAEIDIGTFTVPFTDLVIPAFAINFNKLHEISIPAHLSLPEFTILNSYTIPGFTIDFNEIKAKIVAIIDDMRGFEFKMPDPEEIFGDLKVLYLFELPDLTFQDITLSEIRFPAINIPKLNLKDFEITMLPIPEIKFPEFPTDICIPIFSKLHGELRMNSPHYSLVTTGKIENSTSTPKNPQFTATINSHVKSSIKPLEYTFEATAQLGAPRMKKLLFTETIKATHMAFSIDHEGSLTLTDSSAESSVKTTTKATTQMYKADLVHNIAFTLKSGIFAAIDMTYNHNMDIPSIETSSQASLKQEMSAIMEPHQITFTEETTANGKWSIKDYSDEVTHTSNLDFNINFNTAKLTYVGETACKALKSKKTLTAESVVLSHITIEARCETEIPSFKKSVMILNGEAHVGGLNVTLAASHDAEFTGSLSGSMSNSLEFLAHPFEIVLNAKNTVNSKIFFPLKLKGKVDLLHDYGATLNSEKQRAYWSALARFNQYKYNHNITTENNKKECFFYSSATGEANLDFLTIPLFIPEIKVPFLEMKAPEVRNFSLWEQAGLKALLTTPQQSFDMSLYLHSFRNPDMHSLELDLEPIYSAISDNANIIHRQFEQLRDKVVALLKDSLNQAKSQYIKHKIDTSSLPPRIFTVPGYKIPILNIDVSAFRAEMPAFSFFVPKEVSTPSFKVPALGFSVPSYTVVLPSLGLPVIHVPETLSETKLPTFTLPAIQNKIWIPLVRNITCNFTFKSTLITLRVVAAGLFDQHEIAAWFGVSSTSMFDFLNVKIDSKSTLTRMRGIKLACTVKVEHDNVEASHECAISLTKRSQEGFVANSATIYLPFLSLELQQELTGNTKTKQTVVSKKKINYMFNIPVIESAGKGNLDIKWEMNPFTYVSLDNHGKSDITIMGGYNFAGDLENEANLYFNPNRFRSLVRTVLNLNINKQEKQKQSSNDHILQFNLNKSLVVMGSTWRNSITLDYLSINNLNSASLSTNGRHVIKGELHFVPFTTFKTTLDIDASQPCNLGHAGLVHSIQLAINSENQTLTWSGEEQLSSVIHTFDFLMLNDESQIRMDLTESVKDHLAFLTVKFPVYQKTLWDVLKFDQVTNMDSLQFLNMSYSIVYTKSLEGQEYAIPFKQFENGISFSMPEISLDMPSWVKDILHAIKNIDMRFEPSDVPDHLTFPPAVTTPAFDVPFTNLHVKPVTIDPKNLFIPKVMTTTAFKIFLPRVPTISVPSYNITTEYLQEKMSFLSFKKPAYDITLSSFEVPKTFVIGGHTISLHEITRSISNIQHPTIKYEDQNFRIPEIVLHLPLSVFIPAFGALSTTVKVSSPIYNVSTTANLENKDSNLVTSLNSICTSTMIFLEYDLSANATFGFNDGVISVNGKCNLIHNDANVNWQHVLAQNLRNKRQTPPAESVESRHTLSVDITSRTFTDVNLRFASRKDGITASMSSPSSGFLGLYFQRRSPSQLHGRLFSRYLSTPEKDLDVFTAKATLKNSQKLILQMQWNWDFLHAVIEGTKDRIPAMNDAVLKFINKYHTAHFGFDLNRGSMKLKNTVTNVIERAYNEGPVSLNTLQSSVKHLGDKGSDMYREASDSLMSINVRDVIGSTADKVTQVLRRSEELINIWLDAVRQFLSDIKVKVPGSEEKISSLQVFQQTRRSLSRATDRASQRFASVMKEIARFVRGIKFTIPGTEVVVKGNEFMDNLTMTTASAYDQLRRTLRRGFSLLGDVVNNLFQMITERAENFITYLKDENKEIAPQVDDMYGELLQLSKHNIEEAKRLVAEYKQLTRLNIQEGYNAITKEEVNSRIVELIGILQSHLYSDLNEFVDLMRLVSESTEPYIRVTNKKADIEIPLPFRWKSFSQ